MERWDSKSFSNTFPVTARRVIPLKLDGLNILTFLPLGMGTMGPCWRVYSWNIDREQN